MQQTSLKNSSPKLYSSLKRVYQQSDLHFVEEIYHKACLQDALLEENLTREDGVSYNPRPARIALILISEAKLLDPSTIAASILSCCSPAVLDVHFSEYQSVRNQALQAHFLLKEGFCETYPAEPHLISLALTLDKIRHLHMTSLNAQQIVNQCAETRRWLDTFKPIKEYERLIILINTAINRFLKLDAI